MLVLLQLWLWKDVDDNMLQFTPCDTDLALRCSQTTFKDSEAGSIKEN